MFNPRFIGILKHPGYNGFDPLSATIETAILADVAAPAVASTVAADALIPSILTGIGGIGAGDIAAITAAEAGALPIAGVFGAEGVTPSILTGIGGIGAGDTAAYAAALGGAAPGTVGSTLASSGLSDLASLTPGAIDPATGQVLNSSLANATNTGISLNNVPAGVDPTTGLPSYQLDFNAANAAPGQGITVGTGMPGGTPGAPGVNIPSDAIGKSVIDQVPGNPAFDITSPSIGKFGQGANDAQSILGKMGLGSLEDFYNKNKLLSSVALSAGMGMLGSKQPGVQPIKKYSGPLNKYHLASDYKSVDPKPDIYKSGYAEGGIASYQLGGDVNFNYPQADQHPNQFANQNQLPTAAMGVTKFEPRTDAMTGQMIGYADGGITGYATGDLVEKEEEKKSKLSNPLLEYYSLHSKAKEALPHADVGIFHDTDPDTHRLDAQQAAMMRIKKQYAQAQMAQPKTNLKPMAALGTLPGTQMQEAATGGIMGYSLGGYANGGNPRLLKGPGDGMSDNIPATIANRQPARLADGEFVVPADVVSHLGNGSTEAGAKHLHTMMDKVRVARTGKKKQGTQINPNKFMPA